MYGTGGDNRGLCGSVVSIPTVLSNVRGHEMAMDIQSRLLQDRIIVISEEITDTTAQLVVPQLLYLDSLNNEKITLLVHSPGGSVTAGIAIVDTMKLLRSPIETVAMGMAASMGAVIVAAGSKGMRHATPHSEIMIHEVSAGTSGKYTDMAVTLRSIERSNRMLASMLTEWSNMKDVDAMMQFMQRDQYMTPEEAMEFGLIDSIYQKSAE